ncbi:hypothetical protein BH10ACI1_BH10ACI1_15060 [soil metagenome]
MQNTEWTPPPPPQDDSIFSQGTREYYAEEIRKGANKALIFGILSLFCCPLIFGIMGFTTAQEVLGNIDVYQVGEEKRTMVQIAKVLSIVGMVIWGFSIIARIAMR